MNVTLGCQSPRASRLRTGRREAVASALMAARRLPAVTLAAARSLAGLRAAASLLCGMLLVCLSLDMDVHGDARAVRVSSDDIASNEAPVLVIHLLTMPDAIWRDNVTYHAVYELGIRDVVGAERRGSDACEPVVGTVVILDVPVVPSSVWVVCGVCVAIVVYELVVEPVPRYLTDCRRVSMRRLVAECVAAVRTSALAVMSTYGGTTISSSYGARRHSTLSLRSLPSQNPS